jgi:hypothetical protein
MKVRIANALCCFIIGTLVFGQEQKRISQTTNGLCSPAVVSEGQVTITCTGLDHRQQQTLGRLPALMDQLLKSTQSDRDQLMVKLEEMVKFQKESEVRTASAIATAVIEKTSVRVALSRELDKPIIGLYAIVSLSKPLAEDQLADIAGVVEIFDSINEDRPGLYLGLRPDVDEWTEIPGNKKILMRGIRSEIWTHPRTSTQTTRSEIIDSFFVYRFKSLDRLEIGAAPMPTLFGMVGRLDHASVVFRASRKLIDYFDRLTIVANDFVVLEIKRADIIGWQPPPPPIISRLTSGRLDSKSGIVSGQELIKAEAFDPNFMLPEGFKQFSFGTALFSSTRATAAPPMNIKTSIKLSDSQIRMHRIMGGGVFPHRPGRGSMMILPGEHGWLPKEND